MKKLILCLSIIGLVIASSFSRAPAADQNAVAAATKAADNWLKLIDDGKYSESWTQTSAFFRNEYQRDNGSHRRPQRAIHWDR